MAFLGYDRDRLTALRRRLDEVGDEAARLRFDDPRAGDAAHLYRTAVGLVTAWRADLEAIASCAFASPYQPVWLDPADPSLVDVLRPTDAAWAAVTDPRSGVVVTAEDHARHLAEYLAAVDITSVLDDRRRLGELIDAVAGIGSASTTLLTTLGPERFGRVAEDLARRVAAGGAVAGAAALLRVLSAALGAAWLDGSVDRPVWADALGDRIDPYASALVLRASGLSGADLGRVAAAVWHRWTLRSGDGIDELAATPTQTPDLLVPLLTADPGAARYALAAFTDDDLAQLFGPAVAAGTVLPLLLASADPAGGDDEAVERSMVGVLTFLRHHQDLAAFSRVADGLGAYVSPHLEALISPDDSSAYPVQRWDLHGQGPADLIGWIAGNETAASSLETAVAAVVATRFAQFTADGMARGPQIDHLGALAGTVDAIVARAHVLKAADQTAAWRQGWGLVAGLASLPTTGPASRLVVNDLKGWGLDALRQVWESHRWVGTPLAPDGVAAADGAEISGREDRRQAELMAILYAAASAAGAVLPTAAPPAAVAGEPFLTTRNRWLAAATSPQDAAARETLWRAAEAYDAGVQRARAST